MLAKQAVDMAAYNRWMNERLYAVCAQLSDDERKKDCGAFFKSIHGTLNHILLADKIWMGRFLGHPYAATRLDMELHSDFHALREDRAEEDKRIVEWAASLTDAILAGELRYTGIVHRGTRKYEMWAIVAHFFNHQTHHRGQITTLLSQLGLDMGVTDLIMLPQLVERNAT